MRFFFDYRTGNESLYDYHGEDFGTLQGAIDFATVAAEHLTNSLTDRFAYLSVDVRDVTGATVFSAPVTEDALRAA